MADENEDIGVLNDPDDFDEGTLVQFYEVTVELPTYRIRVYAETHEDAEEMALDHLYETFTFADLMTGADATSEEVK